MTGNFYAWMAQIAVLVAIAAAAGLLVERNPRARLIFWQGVLALALLLPLVQPWTMPRANSSGVAVSTGAFSVASDAPSGFHFEWRPEYLLWIAAAGALARLAWIGIGLMRLRRHRLLATRMENPPVPFEGRARWYVSETVAGPVTFGFLRPNILLPARFVSMPAEIQEAIACHELIHVQRRDWLFVIAEEIVRAMLWFHPGVWFAIAKIQLAREQVVDLESIRLTRDRERYLDALVAVAEHKFQPDLVPATLFLTRRHLAARVGAILKETRMSKSRIAAHFLTVICAALVAARVAVWIFPLHSSAQTIAPDDPGITVDAGAPLMHRGPVVRPGGVTATGTLVIDATLDSKGEVSDARVVSGPDELRRGALQTVLGWHYSNDPLPASPVRVTIQFGSAPAGVVGGFAAGVKGGIVGGAPTGVISQTAPSGKGTATRFPATLKAIEIAGVSPEVAQKVRNALPFREGDQIEQDGSRRMIDAAQTVDEHFAGGLSVNANREATMRLGVGVSAPLPPSPAAQDAAPAPPQRIRVGGNVQQANLITKIAPLYPPDAKAARIQGVVQLSVIIGKDGTVQNIQVISGHPVLVESAMEAVKQWVYRPTLLNGNPVEVITQVDVNYTLSQ